MKIFVSSIAILISLYANDTLYKEKLYRKKPMSYIELRDTNLVRQDYDYSCGAASLATILKFYYQQDTTEQDILNKVFEMKGLKENLTNKLDISFLDLANVAKSYGFRTIALALDFDALSELKIPAIVYIKIRNTEHFSVYKGQSSGFVYLSDPSFGNLKINRTKFIDSFYKRKDLLYPGKVLILVNTKVKGNQEFMRLQDNNISYRLFLDSLIHTQ